MFILFVVYQQIPILIFSFTLVATKVNIKLPFDVEKLSLSDKLKRIDFFGSLTLVGTVGCLLLGFSLKSTEELCWSNPIIWGLFVASGIFGALFMLVESYWAPYPVMPLKLITQRTPLAVSLGNLLTSIAAFSTVRITLIHMYIVHRTELFFTKALQCPFGTSSAVCAERY
jgi:hypothetical protein